MLASRTIPKRGSRYKCAVSGCMSNSFDNLNVSFHKLPAPNKRLVFTTDFFGNRVQLDQLTAWMMALKVPEMLRHNHFKICSLHSKREDFYLPDYPTKSPTLRPTAVPSVNLPGSKAEKIANNETRLRRRLKRGEKIDHSLFDCEGKKSANTQEEARNILNQVVGKGIDSVTEKVDGTPEVDANLNDSESANGGVIVEASQAPNAFVDDMDSGEVTEISVTPDHSYYAQPRSPPSEELHSSPTSSCEQIEPEATDPTTSMPMEVDSQISTPDAPKQSDEELPTHQSDECDAPVKKKKRRLLDDIETDKELSTVCGIESFDLFNSIVKCVKFATKSKWENEDLKLDTAERVIMVYMKLKQKLSFSYLAFTFKPISESHCKRIFFETLKVLSQCLKCAITWPSKEKILSNLPECFEKFENTRIVVDCTEIFVQCPRKTCCQIHLYSYYKGSYTIKVMIGISPAGHITFISKPYGGRWSDRSIVEQSKLIDLLDSGDAIMVDKGFLIDELCHRNKVHLMRPPFKKGKQLSEKDAFLNRGIASARVHVERVNQRIKVFQILGETFPISLVSHFEEILTVICGTVNLSAPIIKDDKFMQPC